MFFISFASADPTECTDGEFVKAIFYYHSRHSFCKAIFKTWQCILWNNVFWKIGTVLHVNNVFLSHTVCVCNHVCITCYHVTSIVNVVFFLVFFSLIDHIFIVSQSGLYWVWTLSAQWSVFYLQIMFHFVVTVIEVYAKPFLCFTLILNTFCKYFENQASFGICEILCGFLRVVL